MPRARQPHRLLHTRPSWASALAASAAARTSDATPIVLRYLAVTGARAQPSWLLPTPARPNRTTRLAAGPRDPADLCSADAASASRPPRSLCPLSPATSPQQSQALGEAPPRIPRQPPRRPARERLCCYESSRAPKLFETLRERFQKENHTDAPSHTGHPSLLSSQFASRALWLSRSPSSGAASRASARPAGARCRGRASTAARPAAR